MKYSYKGYLILAFFVSYIHLSNQKLSEENLCTKKSDIIVKTGAENRKPDDNSRACYFPKSSVKVLEKIQEDVHNNIDPNEHLYTKILEQDNEEKERIQIWIQDQEREKDLDEYINKRQGGCFVCRNCDDSCNSIQEENSCFSGNLEFYKWDGQQYQSTKTKDLRVGDQVLGFRGIDMKAGLCEIMMVSQTREKVKMIEDFTENHLVLRSGEYLEQSQTKGSYLIDEYGIGFNIISECETIFSGNGEFVTPFSSDFLPGKLTSEEYDKIFLISMKIFKELKKWFSNEELVDMRNRMNAFKKIEWDDYLKCVSLGERCKLLEIQVEEMVTSLLGSEARTLIEQFLPRFEQKELKTWIVS